MSSIAEQATSRDLKPSSKKLFKRLTVYTLALIIVATLFMALEWLKSEVTTPNKTQSINKIDVAVLPPPPPPPPAQKQTKSTSLSDTVNVIGLGGAVQVQYGSEPAMAMPSVKSLDPPKFDVASLHLLDSFHSSVPLLEVEHLDRIPKVVSQKYQRPPLAVRKIANNRIETKVELIIDQTGKPYIKKIIDPIYPEMIPTIKAWVKDAHFEIPKKEGKPVQAVYFYNLNFNYG